MMVLPLVAFSVLYNIPKFFELKTRVPGSSDSYERLAELNSTVLNGTMSPDQEDRYDIYPTPLRLNPYYYKYYCMWLNFFLMGLGPFVLLITLNVLTFKELKSLGDQIPHGPESTANRRRDLGLAKVSLAIVFVFIVCHSIKWIPNVYELVEVRLQSSSRTLLSCTIISSCSADGSNASSTLLG